MMKQLKFLMLLALISCVGACASSVEPAVYAGEKPVLDLKEYFNGTVDAWGVVTNRSGKVVKRFTVVIQCEWNGDVGTLDEMFTYSDGSTQKRVWTLKKVAENRYAGSADDVIGNASGSTGGNAFNWQYVLALPVDGRTYHVNFDDWMFLMDDKVMLNTARMSKWGFHLGTVTLAFRKRD